MLSERAATFIHNEVPGIDVPEEVILRLKGLSKEDARQEGIQICLEQAIETLDVAHGYYLLPPFNNSKVAGALIRGIREAAAKRYGSTPSGAAAPASAP